MNSNQTIEKTGVDARYSVDALLSYLEGGGARLYRDGDRLRVDAPDGLVTAEIADAIRSFKSEILGRLGVDQVTLNAAQRRLWAHEKLHPGAGLFDHTDILYLSGALDCEAFGAAFDAAVAAYPILQMRLLDEAGAQMVPDVMGAPPLYEVMTTTDQFDGGVGEAVQITSARGMKSQRLARFAATLVSDGKDRHALILSSHDMGFDGPSAAIFVETIASIYNDGPKPIVKAASIPVSQTDTAQSVAGRLLPLPDPLSPPGDLQRPAEFVFESHAVSIPPDGGIWDKMSAFAEKAEVRPSALAFGLWAAFLARLCESGKLAIATLADMRRAEECANVGCYQNTVFTNLDIDLDVALGQYLAHADRAWETAMAARHIPVEAVLDALSEQGGALRDPARAPVAQACFRWQDVPQPPAFGTAKTRWQHAPRAGSGFDMVLEVIAVNGKYCGHLGFSKGLFSAAQAECLAEVFETFLSKALDHPDTAIGSIALLRSDQKSRVIRAGEGRALPVAGLKPVYDVIAENAHTLGNKIAVKDQNRSITYADLDAEVRRFRDLLLERNVEPGDVVGVLMPACADFISAALAVWSCGACYLPLDTTYPEERLRFMLDDARAQLVLSKQNVRALRDLPDLKRVDLDYAPEKAGSSGPVSVDLRQTAYVIYTSGSSGRPKGVMVSHGSLANFMQAMLHSPGMTADDRLVSVTTPSFDISLLEFFLPLMAGSTVIIADADETTAPFLLADLLEREDATMMQATPTSWGLLVDSGWQGKPTLKALCGGEALSPAFARALRAKVGTLYNMYGPTETTIWSSLSAVETDKPITIGRPIDNTQFYITDPSGKLCPPGVPGELWIGGAGVASGYLGRASLTADRFIADPFRAGGFVYRTGDRARLRHDGDYEILGRLDAQVKLRGFRIELGEIEAAMEALPMVERAAAIVRPDASGEPALVGYVTIAGDHGAMASDIRRALKDRLPIHMIPQSVMILDEMPVTANGKLDRKSLPDPDIAREEKRAAIPPETELEHALADLWQEMLGLACVSVTDNFFELGGQSIQAAQMTAKFRVKTGYKILPRSVMFENLRQLAAGATAFVSSRPE